MHIAMATFYLLSLTGPQMPADLRSPGREQTVTAIAEVISWLSVRSMPCGAPALPSGRRISSARSGSRAKTRPWMGCIFGSSSTQRAHGPTRRLRPRERNHPSLVRDGPKVRWAIGNRASDLLGNGVVTGWTGRSSHLRADGENPLLGTGRALLNATGPQFVRKLRNCDSLYRPTQLIEEHPPTTTQAPVRPESGLPRAARPLPRPDRS